MDPLVFCRALKREYERQWAIAGGHATRHPLRLKMMHLDRLVETRLTEDAFERQLESALSSEDVGAAILAEELLPLWRIVRAGGALPFGA